MSETEPLCHAGAQRIKHSAQCQRSAPLLAGEYPVAEVPHRSLCATCPGRDGMCSYPPELTDRELPESAAAAPR